MGIQRLLSPSLVFLGMTTILFLSKTSEAINVPRPLGGQTADMTRWCSHTDHPVLCNSMLKAVKSGTCEQATKSTISATILQIKLAKAKIATLRKAGGKGKQELGVCLEVYGSAVDSLTSSLKNINEKSLPDLMNNLSAAISFISTCDDAFTDLNSASPIGQVNQRLSQSVSNSLALATEMKN